MGRADQGNDIGPIQTQAEDTAVGRRWQIRIGKEHRRGKICHIAAQSGKNRRRRAAASRTETDDKQQRKIDHHKLADLDQQFAQ